MTWLNAAVATLAVCAGVMASVAPQGTASYPDRATRVRFAASEIVMRGAQPGLIDASGYFVPIADYRRVVSGSAVADGLLLALAEPDRILRFTRYSIEKSPFRYRFAGKGSGVTLDDIEALIALKPDLVLVHNLGGAERVTRLRDAGLQVFNFGDMRGLSTLLPNMRALATLLGRPRRGAELAQRFARRLRNVAARVGAAERPHALYVAIYGDKMYGGTDGTSYHDLLRAAGLRDVAAASYDGWPAYTAEQVLALDPDVIVTHAGMERALCGHPGLSRLRVCRGRGRIVGVDGALVESPGLDLLEAAETVFEAVHLLREAR